MTKNTQKLIECSSNYELQIVAILLIQVTSEYACKERVTVLSDFLEDGLTISSCIRSVFVMTTALVHLLIVLGQMTTIPRC